MSWRPTTDFEEEIVNLQPDHDFIFGALSEPEPQPFYPRPKSHIEYAATKRLQSKKQQEEYETTGRFNGKLHVISEVQRIAGTKPLGEQPTIHDWDNDKDVETEVVAMMRHFGMGPSVEEPLDEKVTLATYPVNNGVDVMKNGPTKVPLLFNSNMFKLKPKASNSSSSMTNESDSANDSFQTNNNSLNESFDTTSSCHDIPLTSYDKARADRQTLLLHAERMQQYDKLNEDTLYDEFTFDTASNNQDSFKTARNGSSTTTTGSSNLNDSIQSSQSSDFIPSNAWNRRNAAPESLSNSYDENCNSSISTKESTPRSKPSAFLQRFIISDESNESSSSSSTSSSSPILPTATYANVAKNVFKPEPTLALKKTATPLSNFVKLSTIPQSRKIQFITTREAYMRRSMANQ